jgi:Flp pilus assembly protein TadG
MRPLIRLNRNDERGAVTLWVGLMMAALLGMGALVIDVGALYAERRELQNGADAAALAVAQDCAGGDCLDEDVTADTYADANARDDAATVDDVCGSASGLPTCPTTPAGVPATDWVMVSTSTDNPANTGREDEVDFVLAQIFGNEGGTVHAKAIAAWGEVGWATTIPVTFSVCEFQALGGTVDGSQFPTSTGYVYLHGEGPDHGCVPGPGNSGLNLPGGFGWLDQSGPCETEVAVGDWVGSDTGNSVPGACDSTQWQNADVLIPLYDETRGSGSGGEYHIIGFAAFNIQGYKLGNQDWNMPGNGKCPGTPGTSGRCLYGEFTEFVTTTGGIGGGTDFGARAIEMIG